jgi:hypothetical protein
MIPYKSLKPSKKALLVVLLFSVLISLVLLSHGIAQDWAWALAQALITVNGLIFGFFILGTTYLSTKESAIDLYTQLIDNKILEQLVAQTRQENLKEAEKAVKKNVSPILSTSAEHLGYFTGKFEASVYFPIVSIGFSLCLFGVNDTVATNTFLLNVFNFITFAAIYFLIIGTYEILECISFVMEKNAESATSKSSEIFEKILRKRLSKSGDEP